jgi:uncharacterized protein YjiS (DUF1127 family)
MEIAMSFYADTQVPSPLTRMVSTVAGIVTVRVRQVFRMLKNRHDATLLASLDDRMLADIGLTRGDVRDAYSEPVWRDPTAILVTRAHERRSSRRRTSVGLSAKVLNAPSIVPAPQSPGALVARSC